MNYPGSKNSPNVYRQIINQIPPHETWLENFGGSAAVSFHKRPAAVNFLVEINPKVMAAAQSRLTARSSGQLPKTARSEKASDLAVSGNCGPWVCHLADGSVERSKEPQWKFLHGDALRWLGPGSCLHSYICGERTVAYFDPPYILSSRSSGQLRYENEFETEAQHAALLKVIRRLDCHVLISHYRCPLYDRTLAGWRRVDFRAGSRGGPKVESLYCNFPAPDRLHEYTFAGSNKDRRQRLNRRIATLLKEMRALPPVEARSVVAAAAVEFNCWAGETFVPRGKLPATAGAGVRSRR